MNFNSSSPRMKRGMASRGGPGKGRVKPSSSGPPQSQGLEGLYSNDRLVNAVTSVLGCTAKVTSKNGKQYEGVFKTISPQATLVLGKANQIEEERQNGVVKNDIIEQFVMHQNDWVKVEFKDVNLEECLYKKDSFKTDVAIAGNKRMNGQKKELEKWMPGDGESLEAVGLEGHQTMEREVNQNGWSAEKMFDVNEKKYGVKSTYNVDMEEYTTKLEKTDTPEYREKEKFAAQKAEEINKESPYERNTFEGGRSEEQLYSSVVRNKFVDRSSASNWRQPHGERQPEREQRTQRLTQENSAPPVNARREPARSQQIDDTPKVQVKEKVEKPATEIPVESKAESKLEAFSEIVKAGTKPVQGPANSPVTPANTPVIQRSTQVSTETPPDTTPEPAVATPKAKVQEIDDLKNFSVNFQLPEAGKKKPKPKKVTEEEEKTSNETTNKDEKDEEAQEVNSESESDQKNKIELNPNAIEFRPRVKRNTPSPRSNSAASSSGTPSPFQNNNSHFAVSPYPPNNIYSRNGPRGRAMRPEYMDPTTGYVNASNATGQPFFAHHMPPPFMHQPSPQGMPYLPPGGLRHPGLQHPLFIQQHHQGHMMVPVGQMASGHYGDNTFYYSPMPMIQSPPQITSPSLPQSQFNFPSPVPQSVNPVRPVNQPPVMPQQPSPPVYLVQRPNPNNEITPTQIMTNRAAQGPSFQGN